MIHCKMIMLAYNTMPYRRIYMRKKISLMTVIPKHCKNHHRISYILQKCFSSITYIQVHFNKHIDVIS